MWKEKGQIYLRTGKCSACNRPHCIGIESSQQLCVKHMPREGGGVTRAVTIISLLCSHFILCVKLYQQYFSVLFSDLQIVITLR